MKMKNAMRLLAILLGCLLILSSFGGSVLAFTPGEPDYENEMFEYDVNGNSGAEIRRLKKSAKVVTIPTFLNGEPVLGFSWLYNGDQGVKEYRLEEGNLFLKEVDGILYNRMGTTLVEVPDGYEGELVIPEGVTAIGGYAVQGCSLITSVKFPQSLQSIGSSAFSGCSKLTSVELPQGVRSIGKDAFFNSALKEIHIPEGIESVGYRAFGLTPFYDDTENWDNGMLYVGKHLISAKKITETICQIREGTTVIYPGAFRELRVVLQEIIVPSSIKRIEQGAFYTVDPNILTLPDKGIEFEDGVFSEPETLNVPHVVAPPDAIGGHIFKMGSLEVKEGVAYIPEGVRSIGYQALATEQYETLYIPASVEYISSNPYGMSYSSSIRRTTVQWFEVDPENPCYTAVDGVLYTKDMKTLVCCPNQKETLIVPEGVTHIASNACYYNESLATLVLPSTLQEIGNQAFGYCPKLTEVELPEGVTNVESYAFYSCTNLKKINFPKSANGFNLNLQEGAVVEIPPEVQYIPYTGKWKNVTFHVTDGSFALEYAQTFGIDYQVVGEAAQLTLGDVNNDIKIDAKDALLVLRISVGKTTPTQGQKAAADVSKDGQINAKDALEILKYAVGKPSVLSK